MSINSEDARKQAYSTVLSTADGKSLFQDLIQFAEDCNDPIRALGRADMVLRLERERKRGEESGRNTVSGRRSMSEGQE